MRKMSDLVRNQHPLVLPPTAPVTEAARKMREFRFGATLVTDYPPPKRPDYPLDQPRKRSSALAFAFAEPMEISPSSICCESAGKIRCFPPTMQGNGRWQ